MGITKKEESSEYGTHQTLKCTIQADRKRQENRQIRETKRKIQKTDPNLYNTSAFKKCGISNQ